MLPIGGLREKSLAAQRAGLKRVIFPRENEPDLVDLPPETRQALEFVPVDTIEEVFAAAFAGTAEPAPERDAARAPGKPGLASDPKLRPAGGSLVARRRTCARQRSWYSRLPRSTKVYSST